MGPGPDPLEVDSPQEHLVMPTTWYVHRPLYHATSGGESGDWRMESVEGKMGVTKEEVEASLTSKLSPSHLEVTDTSGGCGASFEIEIVSEQFDGKRLLERHRMVNSALTEEMKYIHALSIKKALTPAQWKQQQELNNTQSA